MNVHCCPWWFNYLIDNPLRRLLQPPERIFGERVEPGMTVLDAGCGMGIYTFALGKMVGPEGRVVAVDIERKNLAVLDRRARRRGLADRIETVACDMGELPLTDRFDFALAAHSVHEVPEYQRFFHRVVNLLSPGAVLLMLEPSFHLGEDEFHSELAQARQAGLVVLERPEIRFSHAALLTPDGQATKT
jgi:ubiquinone/menaquinone biosynthesis C-methylase UbiE